MPTINYKAPLHERSLIEQIATRALKLNLGYSDLTTIEMDLTATHCNGMELDLEKLLNFDDFNFKHDVMGIRNHLNRLTGKVEDWFLPRSTKQ